MASQAMRTGVKLNSVLNSSEKFRDNSDASLKDPCRILTRLFVCIRNIKNPKRKRLVPIGFWSETLRITEIFETDFRGDRSTACMVCS